MEWLFGGRAAGDASPVVVKLAESTAQGRSAPTREDASSHRNSGNAHFKNREYELAIAEYTTGILAQPTATLHSNRSAAYCALGQYELALADAEAAIALDPTWSKTYSRKGKALYGMQAYRRAADAYARGLELSLKGARSEATQRDAELEALKRQTESQANAFMKVLQERDQLKRQVEDYQELFGDWVKKEM